MPRVFFQPGLQPSISFIPNAFSRLIEQSDFVSGETSPVFGQQIMVFDAGGATYSVTGQALQLVEEDGRTVLADGGQVQQLIFTLKANNTSIFLSELDLGTTDIRAAVALGPTSGALLDLTLQSDWTWIDNFASTQQNGSVFDGASGREVGLMGNDRVFLRDGNDLFNLNAGDDFGAGERGDDSIEGGSGNDTIFGNRGNDVVMGEDGDDWLFGGRGFDSVVGGDGNDLVVGGPGLDRLDGGAGNDTLRGGRDGDVFEFRTFVSAGDHDVIRDFTRGEDKLHFYGTDSVMLEQAGRGTLITWGGGTIRVQEESALSIADDMLFFFTVEGQGPDPRDNAGDALFVV